MSPRGINEVTVATAIAEPGLREQASQALRGVTVTLLGDIWTSGGIAGLGAELSRSHADILLLGLPGLAVDPTEAVRQIRTLSGGPRVIALDNKAEPEVILQAMRGGASEFLYPPFNGQFAEAVLRVADECARQEPARSAAGSVYAFVSAKGGCGATTMACHTAAYLRRQTKKQVLLADLDFCSGNASLLMQAAPRYTMVDALENLNR
jgi:pilus assembly protein CpaE